MPLPKFIDRWLDSNRYDQQIIKELRVKLELLNDAESNVSPKPVINIAEESRLILEKLPTLKDFYVDDLVKILFKSTRSLHRKLKQQNTSFQILFDEERYRRCLVLLQKSGYFPGLIYEELRFTDVKCFYRAFRRWTGMSYSEYKAIHHQINSDDKDTTKPRLISDSEKEKIGGGMISAPLDDKESRISMIRLPNIASLYWHNM